MNAKELRIGSMVKHIDMGDIMTVTGIMQESTGVKVFGISEYKIYCNGWIEHLQPITLTEDWLIRAGFEYDQVMFWITVPDRWMLGDKVSIGLNQNNQGRWLVHFISFNEIITVVDYMHELQNVIQALTGSELEINY